MTNAPQKLQGLTLDMVRRDGKVRHGLRTHDQMPRVMSRRKLGSDHGTVNTNLTVSGLEGAEDAVEGSGHAWLDLFCR